MIRPYIATDGKTTRLGISESNTILIVPHSLPCTAQWNGIVRCNSLHYPLSGTTVGLARKLEELKNFHTSAQLDNSVNENTSAKNDNASAFDHAKIDHTDWNRQYYESFQTPITT